MPKIEARSVGHDGLFLTSLIWPIVIIAVFIHTGFVYGVYLMITGSVKVYTYFWCNYLLSLNSAEIMYNQNNFSRIFDNCINHWSNCRLTSTVFSPIIQSHDADEVFYADINFHFWSSEKSFKEIGIE